MTGNIEFALIDDLIGKAHQLNFNGVIQGPDGSQMLLAAYGKAADADSFRFLDGFPQERMDAFRALLGNRIIGLGKVAGVDLFGRDKVLNLEAFGSGQGRFSKSFSVRMTNLSLAYSWPLTMSFQGMVLLLFLQTLSYFSWQWEFFSSRRNSI